MNQTLLHADLLVTNSVHYHMNQTLLHADSIVTNSVHYHMNQTLLQQKGILSHEPDPYTVTVNLLLTVTVHTIT